MSQSQRQAEAQRLLDQVYKLYQDVLAKGQDILDNYGHNIHNESFKESASNLAYYLAIRQYDLRELQADLSLLGVSSLGRLESRTLETLQSVINTLASIVGVDSPVDTAQQDHLTRGFLQLEENIQTCLGSEKSNRKPLIMTTLPTEAASDKHLVREFIKAGMNIARINCAHDNEETWLAMIDHIRKEASRQKKEVRILMDIAGPKIRTQWLFTTHKKDKIQQGDTILMTNNNDQLPINSRSKVVVGVDAPSIYNQLKVGDPVLIDDGTIECRVIEANDTKALLKATKVKGKAVRLKAERGMNFPKTDFEIGIITEKDYDDIKFASQHADIIGCSFVRNAADVKSIQDYLHELMSEAADQLPLMVKIETVKAVSNLAEIIYQAASSNPLAIMIARGDLATEIGYTRLAEVQQEILWVAEAADVPVVWSTEVLASLVDTGIPTRAEITDAAEGSRADCVMLNKGQYAVEAIKMLDEIFTRMQDHQYKKTPLLRALKIAEI
ncbi:pyruvate kinase [Hutsoniella sourekii]